MIKKSDKIWMDGNLVDWDKAQVHVLTHTLHYGLGMFEGIRCYKTDKGSAIFRLEEHVDRLFASAHIFSVEIPYSRKEIRDAIIKTTKVNNLRECYIRPLVYIGYGAMGLYPKGNPISVAIAARRGFSLRGDLRTYTFALGRTPPASEAGASNPPAAGRTSPD